MGKQVRGVYLRGRTWWLRYTVNGRRVFESAETNDKRTAEILLKKRLVEIHEGRFFGKVKVVRYPLPAAIDDYLFLIRDKKSSWQDDAVMLRRFLDYVGADRYLDDITRLSLEGFCSHLLASGLSKARVNRYTATLKTFFNRGIEWGKISANPVKGLKLFAEPIRVRYLEVGQIRFLLQVSSERIRPIVLTALLTGLRKGDILGLRWQDLDFENRKVWIRQKKTGETIVIHMSESLAVLFRSLRINNDCAWIFNDQGRPLNRFGWVRTDFVKAVKAAGLSDFRFHDLRHTFATQQRFEGRDIAVIKELLGHKSIRMTMRYAHVKPEELKAAVDSLGAKLLGFDTKKIHSPSDIPSCLPSKPSEDVVSEAEKPFSGRWQSGQMHQTVNLAGYALRRFESFPAQTFFQIARLVRLISWRYHRGKRITYSTEKTNAGPEKKSLLPRGTAPAWYFCDGPRGGSTR
jgi:integrase